MSERVLQGPFLTCDEACDRCGLCADELSHRPDLLHIDGPGHEDAYFAFQWDGCRIRQDVGAIVMNLRGRYGDLDIADWLVSPNAQLANETPLLWLRHGTVREVLRAAVATPPEREKTERSPVRLA